MQDAYPDLIIGVHEPSGAMTLDQHKAWIDLLVAMDECDIQFYHLGLVNPTPELSSLAEVRAVLDYASDQGLQTGYMLNGGYAPNDQAYYDQCMEWFPVAEDSVGPADDICFHHWGYWYPQNNVPESKGYTYTQLVLDYIEEHW
jgi:hypothetical protein